MWELETILSGCPPHRVLLALPRHDDSSRPKFKKLYAEFRKRLQGKFQLPEDPGNAVFFAFDADWKVIPLGASSFDSHLTSEDLQSVLLPYLTHVPPDPTQKDFFGQAVAAGDPGSMFALGRLDFAQQDYAGAHEWYQKAAAAGNSPAMNALGCLNRDGRGVSVDLVEALQWFEKAAEAGNASAMANIGALYMNGQGVPCEYMKAKEWLERAILKHDARAMNLLGVLYRDGLGVKADPEKARKWLDKSTRAWFTPAGASAN